MKLKAFREKNKKKRWMILGSVIVFLLIAGILVYRTYAIYQEKEEFNVIKGSVPDQNYDVQFAFMLEDESGNQTKIGLYQKEETME